MCTMRKCFCVIVTVCFFTLSFPFYSWSEEASKRMPPSTPKDKGAHAQVPAQKHPQLSLDSTSYNAGEVWENEKVSHSFTVKNTGTALLNIKKVKPG